MSQKSFIDFYHEIRIEFPQIRELSTWDNYNWGPDGHENSIIMSELAEEMASWVAKGDEPEVQRFMDLVERYFHEGDKPLTSILYSDFLVTIMEVKTATREVIKKMMGTETKTSYLSLLNLYRENDD